mgnify:CR=1 FL=1
MFRTALTRLLSAAFVLLMVAGGGELSLLDGFLFHSQGTTADPIRPHVEGAGGGHAERCSIRAAAQPSRAAEGIVTIGVEVPEPRVELGLPGGPGAEEPAVTLSIAKRPGANATSVARDVLRKVATLETEKSKLLKVYKEQHPEILKVDAQIQQVQTELDVLTVRAPRHGTILQVNVRAGEFAGTTPQEPLMILGEVEKLQVRAEVVPTAITRPPLARVAAICAADSSGTAYVSAWSAPRARSSSSAGSRTAGP